MDKRLYCPDCQCLRPYIRFGSFELKDGTPAKRIRCKACGRTSVSYRHRFFTDMRTNPEIFHKAMLLYCEGYSIKDIASQFKKRQNTVIDWVKKVKDGKALYYNFLKIHHNYNGQDFATFYRNFSYVSKKKRVRQLKQYMTQLSSAEPA